MKKPRHSVPDKDTKSASFLKAQIKHKYEGEKKRKQPWFFPLAKN